MRFTLSLLSIYTLGKFYVIATHRLWDGPGTPLVLLWQDVIVAAAVGFAWRLNTQAARTAYVLALLHFAISLPLLRLMGAPLTGQIMLAGGFALSDSIWHHLETVNLFLLIGTLVGGVALPSLFQRLAQKVNLRPTVATASVTVSFVVAGYVLTPRTDLQGMHRNSAIAFLQSFGNPDNAVSATAGQVVKSELAGFHGSMRGGNILLVGLESTGSRYLAPYGASADPMPYLTELSRNAVIFENAYAPYPESIKGLLSVLASRLPEFGLSTEEFRKRSHPSLASVCHAAGYKTALFHSGRFMYLGMDEVIDGARFDLAEDAGAIGGHYNSSFGVDDFSTVDRVLNWVQSREESSPFFVHYLPVAGHHPYVSPLAGPFPEIDDRSRYLNALHYSDLALRRLIEGLEADGALTNTLVVIYGDHGEAFGEHPANFGHTLYLYEENVRVPLIILAPGRIEAMRVERIVSLAGLAPTVCDLIGVESAPSFEGVSALSNLEQPVRFVTDYSMRLSGLRFGHWKFIDEMETGFARLYDLRIDPNERINLSEHHPDLVRQFRRGIFEWSQIERPGNLGRNPETVAQR